MAINGYIGFANNLVNFGIIQMKLLYEVWTQETSKAPLSEQWKFDTIKRPVECRL